jgi:tight adherence protein C
VVAAFYCKANRLFLTTILNQLLTLPNLITFGAFAIVMIVVFVMGALLVRLAQDPIRARLESLAKGDALPPSAGIWEGLATQIPQTRLDNGILDREIRRAGLYRPTSRVEFLGLRNGLIVLALVGAGLAAVAFGPREPQWSYYAVLIGLVVAALAWGIPRLVLQYMGRVRVQRINESLPFAMDMLTMTMEGGLTMRDALYHVSRELFFAHPAMAVELLIIRRHAELSSLDNAFDQFAKRVDSPEVTSLAALIRQGQRLGTDVVGSINEFADSLRLKRRQTADARSSAAAVQMLFPLVLFMVPAVMIILWGPAILEMINFFKDFESAAPF